MEVLQTAAGIKKSSKKHEDEHRVFPEFPGEDDGRVFLNIFTQAPHRRYSQRCFVGKITFVLDSTILMLWGERTLNRTLKNSRENIIPLPGALMEMRIEQKTIQRFFFSGWSLKPDKVSANVWLSQSSADKKKYTIYKLEYNIQRNGPFPVKWEAALH